MDCYGVPKTRWGRHLGPILNPDASEVYLALNSDERKDYDTLRKALFSHYNVNKDTYRLKMDKLKRKPGETWTVCGKRYRSLVKKWLEGCSSIDDVVELLAKDGVTRLMPRSIANYVKDKNSATLLEVTTEADDFIRHRGWSFDQTDKAISSSTGKSQPREDSTGFQKTNSKSSETRDPKQQSSMSQAGKDTRTAQVTAQTTSFGKKFIDPKIFDKDKGPQCFNCHQWGHKSQECPQKSCSVICSPLTQQSVPWHISRCKIGVHVCNLVLDSGADTTVIAADLVPVASYTGETLRIAGVHSIGVEVPLARVKIMIGNQKIWLKAAVVEKPPHDILLGRDCENLQQLLRDALELQAEETKETVSVVTRQQAKAEQKEITRDEVAVSEREDESFPFGADFGDYQSQEVRLQQRKTRKQKRQDRLKIFQEQSEPLESEESLGRQELIQDQRNDSTLDYARKAAQQGQQNFEIDGGVLFKVENPDGDEEPVKRLVVPKNRRTNLLSLAHSSPFSAHLGRKRTLERLNRRFYWPGMSTDVKQLLQECVECQKGNRSKLGKVPLINLPVIGTPFDRVAMDIVGPLPMTERKNRYVLTLMDMATRYPEALPLRRIDTETVADALIQFFARFGLPKELLSDRGSNFTSQLMKEVNKRLGITQIFASPYHPETNGMLERWHSTLKAMMRKSGKGRKEWDLLLPMLLFAYREATHEATGFSPFELLFGRQVRGPLDLVKEQWEGIENFPLSVGNYLSNLYDKMKSMADIAKERDQAAKQKYKEFYDKGTRPRFFEEGESVLLLMPDGHSKLEACYSGPFTIERKISPVTYQIATPGRGKKCKIVHVNLLKRWTTPTAKALAVSIIPDGMTEDEGEVVLLDDKGANNPMFGDNNLSLEQKEQARALLDDFSQIFSSTPGLTNLETHEIRTGVAKPTRAPIYRIPHALLSQVRQELKSMEELGIIEVSKSAWSSPLVTVRKKDGGIRLCGDYRRLNAITDDDRYAMPRPEELLDRMGQAKFISTLDMIKGYYQVPMSMKDQEKTAFLSPFVKYQFKRMPFGLKNAPTTFQRFIDRIFDGMLECVATYIDDFAVFSQTWEQHIAHLEEVFEIDQGWTYTESRKMHHWSKQMQFLRTYDWWRMYQTTGSENLCSY